MFIDKHMGFPVVSTPYEIKVSGHVRKKLIQGKEIGRPYSLETRGGRVQSHRIIDFRLSSTTVPEPYDVNWKIKNRGIAALDDDCPRGEIVPSSFDESGYLHTEPTKYRGNHYVECYIVKDGKCLAYKRRSVNIVKSL